MPLAAQTFSFLTMSSPVAYRGRRGFPALVSFDYFQMSSLLSAIMIAWPFGQPNEEPLEGAQSGVKGRIAETVLGPKAHFARLVLKPLACSMRKSLKSRNFLATILALLSYSEDLLQFLSRMA
jgi:hypothetical protein